MLTKIALMGLLACALPAQEINNQPRVIADAKFAACINHIGRNMVQNGAAQVPVTIKLEVADAAPSDQPAKPISDPVTAACMDLLAQSLAQSGAATVPFAIKMTAR